VLEQLRVRVRNPFDGDPEFFCALFHGRGHVREAAGIQRGDGTVRGRDGIPMRVALRVAQELVEPSDEEIGDRVLHVLGLVVDLVPGVAEGVHQERLDEPVAPDHGHGVGAALVRQLHGAVRCVGNQPLRT